MYTELNCSFALKGETAQAVIDLLKYMTGELSDAPTILPDHPLFGDTRWNYMLQSDSYYFNADTRSVARFDDIASCVYVTIICNVKNYNGEIEHFLDWITPHIDAYDGEFLGYKRYEEAELPTLLIHPNRWLAVSVSA